MNKVKWILSLVLALVIVAVSAELLAAPNDKKAREYPGGADEEDLKVQTELPTPPVKVDRRTLEQKALQNYMKKSGTATSSNEGSKPEEQ